MPSKFDFEAVFKVVIPERDAWGNIAADQEAMVGMGMYGPSLRHYEALYVCARICLNLENISGKHIYIMSDSYAALRAPALKAAPS
jgi:spore germination cell wall hydrolase CwlJ-like protein